MAEERGDATTPNRRPRPSAPETIELVDGATACAVCNGRFTPKGGESTCPRCSHRTRERKAAPRVGVRREQLLMDESFAMAGSALGAVMLVALLGAAVIAVAALDWWTGELGSVAMNAVWGAFLLVGIVTALPILTPPPSVQHTPKWLPYLAPAAAGFLFALGMLGAATSLPTMVAASLGLVGLLVIPIFLGGVSSRLGRLAAWAGYDPTEAGMMMQAGPIFVGVFVAGMFAILSWFYLRRPSPGDLLALGIGSWLIVRSLIVAGAVSASLRSMRDEARRDGGRR